jgi:hypothetical protein
MQLEKNQQFTALIVMKEEEFYKKKAVFSITYLRDVLAFLSGFGTSSLL